MHLVSVAPYNPLVAFPYRPDTNHAETSLTADATGEGAGGCFYAHETFTFRGFTCRVSSLTASGTLQGHVYDVVQGLRNSALTNGNKQFSITAAGFQNLSFDGDVTIPAGTAYLIDLERLGGSSFNGQIVRSRGGHSIHPHCVDNTNALTRSVPLIGALLYDANGNYFKNPYAEGLGVGQSTAIAANNNEERGSVIELPMGGVCVGFWTPANCTSAQGTHLMHRLYANDGSTVLAQASTYKGYAAASTQGDQFLWWDTPVHLDPGSYWIVARGNSATQGYRIDNRSTGAGNTAHHAACYVGTLHSRQGAGAFTTANVWSRWSLVFSHIDHPDTRNLLIPNHQVFA